MHLLGSISYRGNSFIPLTSGGFLRFEQIGVTILVGMVLIVDGGMVGQMITAGSVLVRVVVVEEIQMIS